MEIINRAYSMISVGLISQGTYDKIKEKYKPDFQVGAILYRKYKAKTSPGTLRLRKKLKDMEQFKKENCIRWVE